MRRSILYSSLALLAGLPGALDAQRNAVYAELFGNALLGSINYERVVVDRVSVRTGLGAVPGMFEVGARVHAPVMLTYVAGHGQHRLEAGGGVVLMYVLPYSGPDQGYGDADHGFARPEATGTLGYRWQPAGRGGLIYRAGLTPWFRRDEIVPLFGVSAGMAF